MAKNDEQVNFRMPAELRQRLKAAADESNRTLTAEIVARLEESFEPRVGHDHDKFIDATTYLIQNMIDSGLVVPTGITAEEARANIANIRERRLGAKPKKPK